MYNYMLGGSVNFAVDREATDAMLAAGGATTAPARLNRAFLRRAVRFMTEQGVEQFLDLGSGIPAAGNVHEIAPSARVVYVDNDPIAVHHAEELLVGKENATMINADLRDVDSVLRQAHRLIDFSKPVGLLMVAIFHFIADTDRPAGIVSRYLRAATGGGYLAISHFSDNGIVQAREAATHYQRTTTPVVARSKAEIAAFLNETNLVEPGVVWTSDWRPDATDPVSGEPSDARIYAGVGAIRRSS
jgi:hypothetical protein